MNRLFERHLEFFTSGTPWAFSRFLGKNLGGSGLHFLYQIKVAPPLEISLLKPYFKKNTSKKKKRQRLLTIEANKNSNPIGRELHFWGIVSLICTKIVFISHFPSNSTCLVFFLTRLRLINKRKLKAISFFNQNFTYKK